MGRIMVLLTNNDCKKKLIKGSVYKLQNISFLLSIGLVFSSSVHAAQWNVTTSLGFTEHYNDNVFLATPGNEQSDFLTEITPAVLVAGRGGRVTVDIDYSMRGVFFAQQDQGNEVYHNLNALTRTELVKDLFYFDVNAIYTQQTVTGQQSITAQNLSVSSDPVDVFHYTLRPFIRTNLGTNLETELQYAYDKSKYKNSPGSDQTVGFAKFTLGTLPNVKFGWNIDVNYRDSEQDNGFIWKQSRAGLDLSYRTSPRLNLLASGGTEKNEYEQTNTELEGSYWNAGFNSQLSPNTMITITAGRRFFGRTQTLAFSHRTRKWQWNVNYNVELTDNTGVLLDHQNTGVIGDPVVLPQDADLTNESFILKGLTIAGVRSYSKTVLAVSFVKQKREYQISGEVDDIYSGSISWRWRFKPRTTLVLSGTGHREEERASTRVDTTYQISAEHRLNSQSHMEYSIRQYERESTSLVDEYKQNIYSVGLVYQF